jgi:hypothetical protein
MVVGIVYRKVKKNKKGNGKGKRRKKKDRRELRNIKE